VWGPASMTTYRVGIDVGGTFTDLIAFDEESGELRKVKVPTTPLAPEGGVIAALRAFLEDSPGSEVSLISHSSTIATNALLGQIHLELPRVALLTTAGFRDVLEIGRQNRSEVYNLFVKRPRPLVERSDRIGVVERLDHDGNVLVPLDRASLDAAIEQLRASDVRAVAVSFLHAYANPIHERQVADVLRERLPGLDVTLSSDIDPEYREYERTSTTVVNALLRSIVTVYLDRLERDVRALGIEAPLYVMQSHGGMSAIETVAKRPATLIESGPASGVIAAAYIGKELGLQNVLSFDMGGTTAKAGTIFGGEPQVVTEFEAAGRTHSGRAVKGSGYPVRFPFIDLAEVSAGGGTIAWIDASGALRVGPLSAGADPGPAAYGKGERPTVTDANIVLGRLNPVALLGGKMPIDAERSRRAIASLQAALDLDVDRIAAGIVALVDNEMAKVLRIVSIERGHDPRTFAMMAFGGGGPLHACALAEQLDVKRVIVPADPGLFSAFGLLAADIRSTAVRAVLSVAARLEEARVTEIFQEMEAAGRAELRAQGVAPEHMAFIREFDVRYLGQSFELSVHAAPIAEVVAAFHDKHERTYGYASRDEAVEIVAARLTSIGRLAKPSLARRDLAERVPPSARSGARSVYFEGYGRIQTPVYERAKLQAGNALQGPAVIEQYDSCTLLPPGWRLRVDVLGNLELEQGA
jgi:N-methylhydantoinase A